MKNTLLLILFFGLISCSGSGNGRGYGSSNLRSSAWVGDLDFNNTDILRQYNLCGNTRSNIKRDVLALGIIGLLSGENNWRNYVNAGTGIAWNRAIVNNCGRINKAMITIFSDQPNLPEGDSIMFIDFSQIIRWNYAGPRGRYNDHRVLDNYIKAGHSTSGSNGSRLIFHQTRNQNETKAQITASLWYQKYGSTTYGREVGPSRRLHILVRRLNNTGTSTFADRDVSFELRLGSSNGNLVGRSTLNYVNNRNQVKVSQKNRTMASFFTHLKTHYLLLFFATTMAVLIMLTTLLLYKKSAKKLK